MCVWVWVLTFEYFLQWFIFLWHFGICSFNQHCDMAGEGGKSFARRDRLLQIEHDVRKWWDEEDVFRAESCEKPPEPGEKFFGNFPYPYMNMGICILDTLSQFQSWNLLLLIIS